MDANFIQRTRILRIVNAIPAIHRPRVDRATTIATSMSTAQVSPELPRWVMRERASGHAGERLKGTRRQLARLDAVVEAKSRAIRHAADSRFSAISGRGRIVCRRELRRLGPHPDDVNRAAREVREGHALRGPGGDMQGEGRGRADHGGAANVRRDRRVDPTRPGLCCSIPLAEHDPGVCCGLGTTWPAG